MNFPSSLSQWHIQSHTKLYRAREPKSPTMHKHRRAHTHTHLIQSLRYILCLSPSLYILFLFPTSWHVTSISILQLCMEVYDIFVSLYMQIAFAVLIVTSLILSIQPFLPQICLSVPRFLPACYIHNCAHIFNRLISWIPYAYNHRTRLVYLPLPITIIVHNTYTRIFINYNAFFSAKPNSNPNRWL